MIRKLVAILILMTLILTTVGTSLANEGNNFCFEGQLWGDGRCNNPDPNVQHYNWVAGWCAAQTANGMSMQGCMLSQGLLGKAVDDLYRTDDGTLDCYWYNYVDIEDGLLANDEGNNLEIVDVEFTNPSYYMFIYWDGDFYFEGDPGVYDITYTLNTGATARAEFVLCPGEDSDAFWGW